jgi:HAD superfamily hydrolase (TIGR01509 family)
MLPDGLFDGIIDSSEVGVRKPNPKIFDLALQISGIPAAKTIFLDDYLEHVTVANNLGIKSIHVGPNPLEAVNELESLFS